MWRNLQHRTWLLELYHLYIVWTQQCFAAQFMCIVQMCVCVCVQCDAMSWVPSNTSLNSILAPEVISIANRLISYMWVIIFWVSVCVTVSMCTTPLCMCEHTHLSLVCEGACVCVCVCVCVCLSPAWGCVFLYPLSWGVSATKARLRSSISFTLRWWESAAPLIVFGVLGQHTQITLCAGVCVCVCVWEREVQACAQRLKIGVKADLPFSVSFADFLCLCQHTNRWAWHS